MLVERGLDDVGQSDPHPRAQQVGGDLGGDQDQDQGRVGVVDGADVAHRLLGGERGPEDDHPQLAALDRRECPV